jgi:SlyX protein
MDQALIDLQTRVAFQDDTLDQLNRTVAEQQRQIDRLLQLTDELRSQVKSLTPSNVASPEDETPPPHY